MVPSLSCRLRARAVSRGLPRRMELIFVRLLQCCRTNYCARDKRLDEGKSNMRGALTSWLQAETAILTAELYMGATLFYVNSAAS
jgi:hypothetical protein